MKIFVLIMLAALLSSCKEDPDATLANPKPVDLKGRWESTSFYQMVGYVLLEMDENGNGIVVVSTEESTEPFAKLINFDSHHYDFGIEMIMPLDEAEEPPQPLIGSVKYGQLCFWALEDDAKELKICFTKSSDLLVHQKKANDHLISYKQELAHNKKRNEVDGSDEPPIR